MSIRYELYSKGEKGIALFYCNGLELMFFDEYPEHFDRAAIKSSYSKTKPYFSLGKNLNLYVRGKISKEFLDHYEYTERSIPMLFVACKPYS